MLNRCKKKKKKERSFYRYAQQCCSIAMLDYCAEGNPICYDGKAVDTSFTIVTNSCIPQSRSDTSLYFIISKVIRCLQLCKEIVLKPFGHR